MDKNYFSNLTSPKVSDELKRKLDEEISEKQIKEVIKQMESDKVPGLNGLPIEFYRKFYD